MVRLQAEMIEAEPKDDPVTQLPDTNGDAPDSLAELLADLSDGHSWFADRRDAGRRLAAVLGDFRHHNPVVVGIPSGGVAVAAGVARALGAPLGSSAYARLSRLRIQTA